MSARAGSRSASFQVECRVRSHKASARAHGLTPEGCLLDTGKGFVVAGDCVSLRFSSGVRVSGRVTMLHGGLARVEFERPLHQAIHDHLTNGETSPGAPAERCYTLSHSLATKARRLG